MAAVSGAMGALPGLFPGGCSLWWQDEGLSQAAAPRHHCHACRGCSGSLGTVPNLGQVGVTLPKPPCNPFWLGLSGMRIFMTWGIVTYQQYFSGFFQFPFPEIPGFKRKEASASTALGAAMSIPFLGGIVSLLGAFCTWLFLYNVVLRNHYCPQKSAVHATVRPGFTD